MNEMKLVSRPESSFMRFNGEVLLFAKPALFHILWKAPVPNLMASRGVKIEFFLQIGDINPIIQWP